MVVKGGQYPPRYMTYAENFHEFIKGLGERLSKMDECILKHESYITKIKVTWGFISFLAVAIFYLLGYKVRALFTGGL